MAFLKPIWNYKRPRDGCQKDTVNFSANRVRLAVPPPLGYNRSIAAAPEYRVTQQEAVDAIRKLLKAKDEDELMQLVGLYLPAVDATFFQTAEAVARQLEREGKPTIAASLRGLTDRMLRMKTLI
jgi:hypothetical protein